MKIVILYSGGVDSCVLYHRTKVKYPHAEVKAIYYDFGQPYAQTEIDNLPDFVEVRKQPWANYDNSIHFDIDTPGIMWGREQFLTVCAYMQEKPDLILVGVLKDEMSGDMSDECRQATENFLQFLSKDGVFCAVEYPFAEEGMHKIDVVRWAVENNLDITKTITCMKEKTPCNKCIGCVQRNLVFNHLGLTDIRISFTDLMKQNLLSKDPRYVELISEELSKAQSS